MVLVFALSVMSISSITLILYFNYVTASAKTAAKSATTKIIEISPTVEFNEQKHQVST
jgi:hypothetical protein